MANVLTGMRILCGILILCFPAFSEWYYFFYLLGGFTDAVDGTVARKLGKASDFGTKFDTVADFVFAISVTIKIIGTVSIPVWLIIWISLIAMIKIGCHLVGLIKYHELRTVHSVLNKVCGGVVFCIPLFIGGEYAGKVKCLVVIGTCILASVVAIAEGVEILGNNQGLKDED